MHGQPKHRFLLLGLLLCVFPGCAGAGETHANTGSNDTDKPTRPKSVTTTNAVATPTADSAGRLADPLRGTVKETMVAGGYTYVLLIAGQREVWAAARRFDVAVGDQVELAGLQPMRNFRSRTLGRVFEEIQFVGLAKVLGKDAAAQTGDAPVANVALPPGHPPLGGDGKTQRTAEVRPPTQNLPPGHPPLAASVTAPLASKPLSEPGAGQIQKLADGVTVADLFAHRAEYAGKRVRFRGRVVKVSLKILGSNWFHVQDGTGVAGTNDITVTSTKDFAPVGNIVVVEGTLGINKDFGAGYKYDVIVENATVVAATKEFDSQEPAHETADE